MQACKHCGRLMGDKACRRHEKVCEKNPNPNSVDLSEEVTAQEATDNDESAQQEDQAEQAEHEDLKESSQPAPPPSFPAAMCPDTLVLKENNQMFFKVTGRRIGDVVYIEAVKMDR